MIYEVMKHIRNFFPVKNGRHVGFYKIEDGTITLPFLQGGQYFAIFNSVFNDGVYVYPPYDLRDEEGEFEIVALKPDKDFINLVHDIEEWQEKYGSINAIGPYTSETLGEYSYSKSTNDDGSSISWEKQFRKRLNTWRKR